MTLRRAAFAAIVMLGMACAGTAMADRGHGGRLVGQHGGHFSGHFSGGGHFNGYGHFRSPPGITFRGAGHYYGDHYYGGRHFYRGPRFGFYFGPGFGYYPAPYYYPSPYYAPAITVPSAPPVYIERGDEVDAVEGGGEWFYCSESKTYYPYVKQCPGGWQRVPAEPR